MSEVRFSIVELRYLRDTFDLVLQELEGIEESPADYVLTTGAKEEVEDCLQMLELKEKFLEPDSLYEPLDFADEDMNPPWEVE